MRPTFSLRTLLPAGAVGLLLVGATIQACSTSNEWSAPQCRDNADCGKGLVCHLFTCVSPDSLDSGPVDGGDAGVVSDAGGTDAGDADAGVTDAGDVDAGDTDAGTDAGPTDAGEADANPTDAGEADAGPTDAGPTDAGEADAGDIDAGTLTYLAPAGAATSAGPVDGIECEPLEQLVFHIHAHIQVYVNGEQRLIPPSIGFGSHDGSFCISWLHTHDTSGVVHIESPVQRVYTLGDFFDVWGVTLTSGQVASETGTITAYLNGELVTTDIRLIPLESHNLVQLDVGSPVVSPQPFTFPGGL
jgi:hypothetical protein